MPSQEEQWVRMAQPEKWTLKPNSAFILSESLEVLQLMKNIMPSISTSTLTKDWSKMHLFSVDIIGKSHPRKAIVIESHCVEILKYIGKYIYKYLAIIALLFNENLERLWKGHCFDFTKKVSFGKFCVHTLVGLTQEITRFVSCGCAYWEGARSVPFRYKNKMGKRLFEPKGQIWRLSSFLPSLLKTLKTFKCLLRSIPSPAGDGAGQRQCDYDRRRSGQWKTPPWQAVCNSWPHVAQRARTFVVLIITNRDRVVVLPTSPAKLLPVTGKESFPSFPIPHFPSLEVSCVKLHMCKTTLQVACPADSGICWEHARQPHPSFLWRAGSKLQKWISLCLETNTSKAWDSLDRAHRIKSVPSDNFRSHLGTDEKLSVGLWEAGSVGQLLWMMVLRLIFGPRWMCWSLLKIQKMCLLLLLFFFLPSILSESIPFSGMRHC